MPACLDMQAERSQGRPMSVYYFRAAQYLAEALTPEIGLCCPVLQRQPSQQHLQLSLNLTLCPF